MQLSTCHEINFVNDSLEHNTVCADKPDQPIQLTYERDENIESKTFLILLVPTIKAGMNFYSGA